MSERKQLTEKFREAVASVLPITLIVTIVCFSFVPVTTDLMLSFLIGSVLLIVGMALFTLGSEVSMTQIGTHMGAKLTKSRKLWLILTVSFLLGVAITVAEPDLQVLAANVPNIDTTVLIITVSVGVGIFLLLSMLRILLVIPLRWMLLVFYALIFILAALVDKDFLAVAFDSGGVTTGPMTVPFIMALGVGVSSIRSDSHAQTDSFGLVALCSIGPILAVMLLGFIYRGSADGTAAMVLSNYQDTVELGHNYISSLPAYLKEVVIALLPIVAFFLVFLTGVNVGFSSLGYILGERLAAPGLRYWLIPLAMLMGWFIINAEPAVHVLNKQVEELSAGAISARAMGVSLSIAVSSAMGLGMVRVLTGISILWFVVPGYVLALAMAFFVPQTFTAIAFDSGGVASGPLTATFMLPFAMGACTAMGGNIMTDAFGIVALVAMMPLITVQAMGVVYVIKSRRQAKTVAQSVYAENDVIELWEV